MCVVKVIEYLCQLAFNLIGSNIQIVGFSVFHDIQNASVNVCKLMVFCK